MSHSSPVALASSQAGSGDLVIILHGFLGSGRNWQSFAKQLAKDHFVVWADMRNHGASPWSDEMNYPAMASDIVELVNKFGYAQASLIGHSMGGKAAMMAALLDPGRIERLVVADIAPVAYDHDFDDIIAAMRGLDLNCCTRRSEADAAMTSSIEHAGMRAFILQNLDTSGASLKWRCNLDVLERSLPLITGWELPKGASPYHGQTLFLYGENSKYVRASAHGTIQELFPNHRMQGLANAGHWLHADAPMPTLNALKSFLSA